MASVLPGLEGLVGMAFIGVSDEMVVTISMCV